MNLNNSKIIKRPMENMLYFIELNELENFSNYVKFISLLSPEKQTQIHKFRFDIDKKLSLFADLFVRYSACKILNQNNTNLFFDFNAYGKPYLPRFTDFEYNISHTRNAIVIGVSCKTIGVDIEKIKSADIKIAERFFSDNELAYILSSKERNRAFYEVWTRKEAYIKWIGKGLSIPLSSFDTVDHNTSKNLRTIEIGKYILTICCESEINESDIRLYNENQAIKILFEFAQNHV